MIILVKYIQANKHNTTYPDKAREDSQQSPVFSEIKNMYKEIRYGGQYKRENQTTQPRIFEKEKEKPSKNLQRTVLDTCDIFHQGTVKRKICELFTDIEDFTINDGTESPKQNKNCCEEWYPW